VPRSTAITGSSARQAWPTCCTELDQMTISQIDSNMFHHDVDVARIAIEFECKYDAHARALAIALAIDQFGGKTRTVFFVQSCACSSFPATGELDGK
jgi:hypothetical protein